MEQPSRPSHRTNTPHKTPETENPGGFLELMRLVGCNPLVRLTACHSPAHERINLPVMFRNVLAICRSNFASLALT